MLSVKQPACNPLRRVLPLPDPEKQKVVEARALVLTSVVVADRSVLNSTGNKDTDVKREAERTGTTSHIQAAWGAESTISVNAHITHQTSFDTQVREFGSER